MGSPHLPGYLCILPELAPACLRLPRYQRAGPSTSLDEKMLGGSVPYLIKIVKIIKILRVFETPRVILSD
jgi:hypothetical protein